MFGLIRRISYSVIPRPDRPWEEDPTSNAPTRRKRRISSTEPETSHDQEGEQEGQKKKRMRGDSESEGKDDVLDRVTTAVENAGDSTTTTDDNEDGGVQREASIEVKSVTKGVEEVELEDKPAVVEGTATTTVEAQPETVDDGETQPAVTTEGVHPESIPLPGEDDESDDLASSSPSPTKEAEEEEDAVSPEETATTTEPSSHDPVPEEPTATPSSPGKPQHTPSPRKPPPPPAPPSQSPQKLFTTV